MKIRFMTFEQYHNKKQVGSTQIRVKNLLKHWDEAEVYTIGEKPDVMIFQKVYIGADYIFPRTLDCPKILDICDPDWLQDHRVAETVAEMDAVVVPTEEMRKFISQLTDKPVKIIKDRFELTNFPKPIKHIGKAKGVVWFGYSHNANCLKPALHAIKEMGLHLTIISDKDPAPLGWAEAIGMEREQYTYIKYDKDTVYNELSKQDIALLPFGLRPYDIYKSENKDIISTLCGLPVAKTRDDLERFIDPDERNNEVKEKYESAYKEYDCRESVKEYKELIDEIKN